MGNRLLGRAYAGTGSREEAVRHGREGLRLSRSALWRSALVFDLALIYAQVGEAEAMFDTLDELLSNPALYSLSWIEADPTFDPYRTLPRYEQLVERYTTNP